MTSIVDRLPAHLRELAQSAVRVAATTPGVSGLTLGGSAVHGGMDRWSDLDLVVVCDDDAHANLLQEARTFAAAIGPVLSAFTGEHVGEPRLLICLYGPDPVHVDLKFVARRDAGERIEDGLILWQRDNAVAGIYETTEARWHGADPQWIEDRFWTWIHYGAIKIGRGELFDAIGMFAFLRDVVFGPLIALTHDRKPNAVRRIEMYAPAMVAPLAATVPAYDRASCLASLRTSIALYELLATEVSGVTRREAARIAVLQFVDAIEADLRRVGD